MKIKKRIKNLEKVCINLTERVIALEERQPPEVRRIGYEIHSNLYTENEYDWEDDKSNSSHKTKN